MLDEPHVMGVLIIAERESSFQVHLRVRRSWRTVRILIFSDTISGGAVVATKKRVRNGYRSIPAFRSTMSSALVTLGGYISGGRLSDFTDLRGVRVIVRSRGVGRVSIPLGTAFMVVEVLISVGGGMEAAVWICGENGNGRGLRMDIDV